MSDFTDKVFNKLGSGVVAGNCVWNNSSCACSSPAFTRVFFVGQISVPVCDAHTNAHAKMMMLNKLDPDGGGLGVPKILEDLDGLFITNFGSNDVTPEAAKKLFGDLPEEELIEKLASIL